MVSLELRAAIAAGDTLFHPVTVTVICKDREAV